MTANEWFRVAVFAFGTMAIIGSVAEMWYGPRRGMTWAQFLRYLSLTILIGTVMVAQYRKIHVPITGYTVAFGIGLVIASLGISPRLRTPMRPTKEKNDALRN